MHFALLATHNVLRWVILALALATLVAAAQGLRGARPYARARRTGVFFTAALHLQLLLGLALFATSPFIRAVMSDMRAAMGDASRRFFVAEHPTLMVVAVLVMTVGGIVAKNAADDAARHRKLLVFTLITLALLAAGMPWARPFVPGG